MFLYCNHAKYTLPTAEPHPPSSIVNIDCSIPTSIAFNWTHIPVECYKNRISYYVSWVNIDNNTENGSDVTGEHMYNITGLVANSNYTISVWTVVDGNVQSTAVTRDVTTGEYNQNIILIFSNLYLKCLYIWDVMGSLYVYM